MKNSYPVGGAYFIWSPPEGHIYGSNMSVYNIIHIQKDLIPKIVS